MGCCGKGGGPPGSWMQPEAAAINNPQVVRLVPDPPPAPPAAPKSIPWWVWALVGLLVVALVRRT